MSVIDPAAVDRVRHQLVAVGKPPTVTDVARALRDDGVLLDATALLSEASKLFAELAGVGPLTGFLNDPLITDVLVTSHEHVWIDRGNGIERTQVTFPDDASVRRLAQRLASACGRRLDDAAPYCDARLSDGTRFHAVLSPVALSGTCISLRVPRRHDFDMAALVAAKSVPSRIVPWIQAIVDARLSVLLTGGTGCGKTTWLSVLLDLIDPDERIVLVEDSAELHPQHAHVVRLEARPPNVEGSGAISLRDLVRQALRMRPDRLVVGEVRGAEVVDLLAAMNTGHEGGFATVHANSAADVPARLEALGQAAGLDRAAVHSQLIAGVDVVIHLRRDRDGRRRWSSISVASRTQAGCEIRDALLMHNGRLCRGPGLAQLQQRLGDYAPEL